MGRRGVIFTLKVLGGQIRGPVGHHGGPEGRLPAFWGEADQKVPTDSTQFTLLGKPFLKKSSLNKGIARIG